MKAHETASPARDFSDQEIVNGKLLASIPTERAGTNALIIRHGYIVAEFGDTMRPDPTYSVAKSMLSTVAGIALQTGLIPESRRSGRERDQGRRLRLSAQPPRHLAAITFSRNRNGKARCGARMPTSSARKPSAAAR